MSRTLRFLPAVLALAILSAPCRAQDPTPPPAQPSLADVARQARKDKEKNASKAKSVVTDDNLAASVGLGGVSIVGEGEDKLGEAMAKVDEAEANLRQLDALDRSALAKAVLTENDVDFPGRRNWEDKLFAEKQRYVSHQRELITEMRQVVRQIQTMEEASGSQGKLDPNNPQVKQIKQRLADITQDATRTEQSYRAVVTEGTDLAKKAKH